MMCRALIKWKLQVWMSNCLRTCDTAIFTEPHLFSLKVKKTTGMAVPATEMVKLMVWLVHLHILFYRIRRQSAERRRPIDWSRVLWPHYQCWIASAADQVIANGFIVVNERITNRWSWRAAVLTDSAAGKTAIQPAGQWRRRRRTGWQRPSSCMLRSITITAS